MSSQRFTAPHFDGQIDYFEMDAAVEGPIGGPITVEFWNYVLENELRVKRSAFAWEDPVHPDRASCHAPWGDRKVYWDYGRIVGYIDRFVDDGRLFADYSNYLGKWTYVALVSEGAGGKFQGIYLDGELVAEKKSSTGPCTPLRRLSIGRGVVNVGEHAYRRGAIAGFRYWNRVRSEEEIRARYRETAGRPSFLRTSEHLVADDFLVSENRNYFAILQRDGDFCVYEGSGPRNQGQCLWRSQMLADGGPCFATMEPDGNFCIYKGADPSHQCPYVWGTEATTGQFFAVMQNDGNFCVYHGTGPEDQGPRVWGWMDGESEAGGKVERALDPHIG